MNQAIGGSQLGYALPQQAEYAQKQKAFAEQYAESQIRKDLSVGDELKNLQSALNELENAASDLVAAISPVLFFGPECGANPSEDTPPGSDIARDLYQKRVQALRTASFLRLMTLKVNL